MAPRALTCPNCGASLSVESGEATTTCTYCDTTVEVSQVKGSDKATSEDLFPEFGQNQVSCPSCGKAGLRPRIRTADFRCQGCGAIHDRQAIEQLAKVVRQKKTLDRLKHVVLEEIKRSLINENPPPNPYLVTVKDVDRPEPSEDERAEALSLILDTFPPDIATELIAKNMHPNDIEELVRRVHAAKGPPPTGSEWSGCLVLAVSLGPAYGVFHFLDDAGLVFRIGAAVAVIVVVFVVGAQVADRLTGKHQRLEARAQGLEERRQAAAALDAWCETHPLLAPGGTSIERDISDPIYLVARDLEREKRLLQEMRRLEYVEAILNTYAAEPQRGQGLEVIAQIRALEGEVA